jgi:hypothetical protein
MSLISAGSISLGSAFNTVRTEPVPANEENIRGGLVKEDRLDVGVYVVPMGLHPIWRWFHNHGLCSTDIWLQNQKSLSEKCVQIPILSGTVQCCVDRHHADYADADPDPTFHFDADPDPDPTSVLHMLENQKKIVDFYSQL